jgi:hypothetical protein
MPHEVGPSGWRRRDPYGTPWRTGRPGLDMKIGGLLSPLTRNFFGADDGIPNRDPHLGKFPEAGPLTCGDVLILSVTWEFSFACNGVVSRRCAFVHGTPTGPLCPSADDGQTGEQASRSDSPSSYEVVYEMDPPDGTPIWPMLAGADLRGADPGTV